MANSDAWNSGWKFGEKKSKNGTPTGDAKPSSFAKGGKVKKTGMAKVHRGEIVLTAAQAKACSAKKSKKKASSKRTAAKR